MLQTMKLFLITCLLVLVGFSTSSCSTRSGVGAGASIGADSRSSHSSSRHQSGTRIGANAGASLRL